MAGAGKRNTMVVPLPKAVPTRAQRKSDQKLGEFSLGRVAEAQGPVGRRMEIPRKSAKRSRAVREARERGDGPGMTNPHGYAPVE